MGLREEMEAALSETLEDSDLFGWAISLKDPDGLTKSLNGSSSDIAQVIDPETGVAVSGRVASIALRISSIYGAGFTSLPKAISNTTLKPWIVTVDDINGNSYVFKVKESNPDRTMGVVVCYLEVYSQ